MLGLCENDCVMLGLCEGDTEIVPVWLPVCDAVRVRVPLLEAVCEPLCVMLRVPACVGVRVAEAVAAWLVVPEGVRVDEGVEEELRVCRACSSRVVWEVAILTRPQHTCEHEANGSGGYITQLAAAAFAPLVRATSPDGLLYA